MNLREKIEFYLIDSETVTGKIVDIFIIALNLIALIIFILSTYKLDPETEKNLWYSELVIVSFFSIEYILRLYGSKSRIKHFFEIYSVIDLIAIAPTIIIILFPHIDISVISILRVFKVFRIFRFLRFTKDPQFFFGTINFHALKVMRLLFTIFMIFFVSSGFFWWAEFEANNNLSNFGDSFYYTVVTLTTVGFGDITPVTEAGRWVTVLMIISGIILIPWQAGLVIREWMYLSRKRDIECKRCGLTGHDLDASHCKHCGELIYQKYEN
ncbi:MAG: ion transporter [Candidatus Cloacimonadota bacterium]|nr:MAG: ion transporter [Candidatus Cloacimonadota bacterium]PIE79346.1 MAG: ion transporter [Candidatus Delongbacteria bacterium]